MARLVAGTGGGTDAKYTAVRHETHVSASETEKGGDKRRERPPND